MPVHAGPHRIRKRGHAFHDAAGRHRAAADRHAREGALSPEKNLVGQRRLFRQSRMSTATIRQHQKEIDDAERLLFTGEQRLGLAKGLFFGRFIADWAMPYPTIST